VTEIVRAAATVKVKPKQQAAVSGLQAVQTAARLSK
jgi:hypothetical protein